LTFFKPDDFEKTMVEDGIGKPYQTITVTASNTIDLNAAKYKYAEGQIISDLKAYIDKTYNQHYKTNEDAVECFDAWIALGDSTPTFRNTALKYLWRYGKKNGNNKADLMKALHYVLMCLYVDHYKGK
jgi:hypothetical protein